MGFCLAKVDSTVIVNNRGDVKVPGPVPGDVVTRADLCLENYKTQGATKSPAFCMEKPTTGISSSST